MYGGLGVSEVRRIKELQDENRTLKQLAGEQALVIETMKRKFRSNGGGFNCATQSALVELLRVQKLSQRRACSYLGISPLEAAVSTETRAAREHGDPPGTPPTRCPPSGVMARRG